jgi:hypothetical protein
LPYIPVTLGDNGETETGQAEHSRGIIGIMENDEESA